MAPLIIKTHLLKGLIIQAYYDDDVAKTVYRCIEISKQNNYLCSIKHSSIDSFVFYNEVYSDQFNIFIIPDKFDFSNGFLSCLIWKSINDFYEELSKDNKDTLLKIKELINSYILFI